MSDEDDEFDLHDLRWPPERARLTQRHMTRRYVGIEDRHFINDTIMPGFSLMITRTGHKSLVFRYRYGGKTDKLTLRTTSVEEARAQAAAARATLLAGRDPRPREVLPTEGATLREVTRAYLAKRQFKSSGEFARALDKHVLPKLGDRAYESITRQDLARLRDDIAQRAGKHAAHYALRCLGAVWSKYYVDHASDGFTWPEVRSPLEAADRNGPGRALSDREIREVWHATERLAPNKAGWFKFLFLTGLRRTSAARITRAQIADDWSKVAIPGSQTKPAYDLILSQAARELLQQHFPAGATWAFEHLGPYAPLKAELDIQVGQIAPWRLHDIRHTVRSLLSRVTTPDVAELALGHALKGMQKRYDHYDYAKEKLAAMEKLAEVVVGIVKN